MEGADKQTRIGEDLDGEMHREREVARCRPHTQNPGRRQSTGPSIHQAPRIAAQRRIRSGFVSRSCQPYTCKSPSTDSTTSLAQLRDRLTVLSPLKYSKVPTKIASTPDLPVVHELDERESLNNSLPKTRCGVSLKYYSDGEVKAKTVKKKTGRLSPVVENHSASLLLAAALGNADQSVTKDVFEELYKSNSNLDLADLLVAEALEQGQEKDSGVISGKVTQDSDVVENTPVEKTVRRRRLSIKSNAKSVSQDKTVIDDTEIDVIEDTPCYVYDRKARVKTNSTVDNIISKENITIDKAVVDAFFSQHMNQNNTENVISPTLAKKINETSSESSDDDCILIEGRCMENALSVKEFLNEAVITDCLYGIIDKVCDNADKCAQLVSEPERQIDNLELAKNVDVNSKISPGIFKTSKENLNPDKDISYDKNIDETKKVNQSKKVVLKMNTRKKTARNVKNPNDVGKSNVLVESTNTSSPLISAKTTSTRMKRKLYSPKDDENESNELSTTSTRVERKQSKSLKNVNETPIATCYRELENARKTRRKIPRKSKSITQARKSRCSTNSDGEDPPFQERKCTSSSSMASVTNMSNREKSSKPVDHIHTLPASSENEEFEHNRDVKSKTANKIRSRKVKETSRTQPILSPKTRKLNEMFDKIKGNVCNEEKITLVEKKNDKKDLSYYNLSSESEDGNFKTKKIQVHKRLSSFSINSSATKRRRSMTRVNYSEYHSSEDEGKVSKKPKTVKQAKQRNRKTSKIPKLNLIDERMRNAQQETLDTSFVKETVETNNVEEPEPVLQQAPALEVICPDELNDDVMEGVLLENKTQIPAKLDPPNVKKETNSKKCENVTRSNLTKKGKENIKNAPLERDSAPVSPLPGLVVETERPQKYDFTSSMETNLLQKFKKIYTDANVLSGTGDTQNLLSNPDDNYAVLDPAEIREPALVSDVLSEVSIATGGRSPITAHNDLNESPPNVEMLHEDFQHRDLHNEVMSESIAEYLVNMRNHLQGSKPSQKSPVMPITRMSSKDSARLNACVKRLSSRESVNKSVSRAESNKRNKTGAITRKEEMKSQILNCSPKSKVSSVILTRMSSEEIVKYLTPTRTKTSSDTGSPKIRLERISSDEINRWLPMSEPKFKDAQEKPKKYNTRQTTQLTDTKSPVNVVANNIKPKISPVKLNFDIVDLTMPAGGRVTRVFRNRSATKSMKSHADNTNQDVLKTDSIKSSTPKARTEKSDQTLIKSSQETIKSSVATRLRPDKTRASVVDPSDMNKSLASVHDWFKRNATPSSPNSADNHAKKEMLCKVMEALQTTLAEIHQATGERFTAAYLKEQEEISSIEKEMKLIKEKHDRILEKIALLKKNQKERGYEVIRADGEKKTLMVKLLQEDIQRLLNQC